MTAGELWLAGECRQSMDELFSSLEEGGSLRICQDGEQGCSFSHGP